MQPAKARGIVIGSGVAIGTVVTLHRLTIRGRLPKARVLVGGLTVAVLLVGLSEASPDLAAALALLALTGTIVSRGPSMWANLARYFS
jgi:hypothetical protein